MRASTHWLAIVSAPLAWVLQLWVNVTVSAHACYPHDVPLAQPIWAHLAFTTALVEAIAICLCVFSGGLAWRNWQRTRNEKPGTAHRLIESGDGRARFLAMVAMLTSGLFLFAVVLTLINLAAVPPCGG